MALGTTEIVLVVGAILLLFGATAIPRFARSLGKAQGEFQKARGDFQREIAAGAEEAGGPPEEQIRKTARELGIDEADLDLPAVKRAINEKLSSG
jgi:sec-independent protein translocase protein TatA